jgi:hypothetical protein
MTDFFSLDGQHLWALIQNNHNREFLFSTTDGGASWKAFPLPYPMWRVFFIDRVEGWGIAAEPHGSTAKTFCVHTSDSGRTWQRLGSLNIGYEHPTGIAFDNKEHGWVVGEGYVGVAFVLQTIDGGKHWKRLDWKTEPASGLYGVRVHDGVAFTWSGGAGGSGIFELRRGALPKRIAALTGVKSPSRKFALFVRLGGEGKAHTCVTCCYRQSCEKVASMNKTSSRYRSFSYSAAVHAVSAWMHPQREHLATH